jgi:hypothetical protein
MFPLGSNHQGALGTIALNSHLFSDEKNEFMASAAVVTIALMGSVGVIVQKVLGEWFLRQAVYPHDDICEMPETYQKKKKARMHPTRFLRAATILEIEKEATAKKLAARRRQTIGGDYLPTGRDMSTSTSTTPVQIQKSA